MAVTLEKGFEPLKLTLPEASKKLGLAAPQLRGLYFKHPGVFKGLIFQDWNDTRTYYELMVYNGDMDKLREALNKVAPSPVSSLSPKTLTRGEIAERLGVARFRVDNLFTHGKVDFTPVSTKQPFKYSEDILPELKNLLGAPLTKVQALARARESLAKKRDRGEVVYKRKSVPPEVMEPKQVGPKRAHDTTKEIAIKLIQNGFPDAGVWLLQHG